MIGRIMRRRANEQPVVGLSLALPNVNQSIRTKFTGGAASLPLCLPLVNGICTDRLLLSVPSEQRAVSDTAEFRPITPTALQISILIRHSLQPAAFYVCAHSQKILHFIGLLNQAIRSLPLAL
jgi:hypothetical protein